MAFKPRRSAQCCATCLKAFLKMDGDMELFTCLVEAPVEIQNAVLEMNAPKAGTDFDRYVELRGKVSRWVARHRNADNTTTEGLVCDDYASPTRP